MWQLYKIEDASGNNLGTEDLDCILLQWFESSTDMTISFVDLLDAGYTFNVTVTPAEDEDGVFSEVFVNVDKEIENCPLRILPRLNMIKRINVGFIIGSVIYRTCCHFVAPSILADSYIDWSIPVITDK